MASLYEIDNSIQAFIDSMYEAVDENGEIKDIDFDAFEALKAEQLTKRENIILAIKNLNSDVDEFKAEETRLAERRKRKEKKIDWLKGYLIQSMQASGDIDFETARCKAKIKDNEVTVIDNDSLVPDDFCNIKTERKPDKTAIKKAIKAGQQIAGAHLDVNTTINIK